MQSIVKWGIVGTSPISEVMARAIQASKSSELVAIGSRDMEKGKKFANTFFIPKVYETYQKLLNDHNINAIYLGLPNHLHKDWIIRCAQAGKHVLCEKPFVISIAEANEVIETIKDTNVICMEALMYRSHPVIKKLQEIIQSKILGEVKLYNATYTAHIVDVANPIAGGSIRNLGCYLISLVRLLANAEPISISGIGRFNSATQNDNQASVILKFADNTIAVVSTADDIKMTSQFEVHGTNGYLKMLTNPWMPGDENKIVIYLHHHSNSIEINISADKPLYTYQIDVMNAKILKSENAELEGVTLSDSLGNTIVLETWLQQVKSASEITKLCA